MSEPHQVLTSTRNPRVVELAKLHDPRRRRAAGVTLVEGPHQFRDVVAFGAQVREAFVVDGDAGGLALAEEAGVPVTSVGQSVLRRIAGTEHPRGPVGVVTIPEPDPLVCKDTVVLWDVRDPGNAGAIIRSAAAFGFAVATTPTTVDVWAPKVVRAAAATQFGTRVSPLGSDGLQEVAAVGLQIVATVVDGGTPLAAALSHVPVAVFIGNEAHGLPQAVMDAASVAVTIGLDGGVESLNAAVAAGIVLFVLRRR